MRKVETAVPEIREGFAAVVPNLIRGAPQGAGRMAVAFAVLLGCFADRARATELFAEMPPDRRAVSVSSSFPDPDLVSRVRILRADRPMLDTARETVRKEGLSELELNLFPDAAFRAVLDRTEPTATGYVLSGSLKGIPFGRVTLVVNRAALAGVVHTPGGSFVIRQLPGGAVAVAEADFSLLPACGVGVPGRSTRKTENEPSFEDGQWPALPGSLVPVGSNSPESAASIVADEPAAADDGSVIDVAVMYTRGALEAAGDRDLIEAEIDLAAAQANTAYAGSDVALRIKVVFVGEFEEFLLDPSRTRSWPAPLMLEHLRVWSLEYAHARGPDGVGVRTFPFRDGIEPMRSAFAADLVHIVGHGNCLGCVGVAFIMGDLGYTEYRALPSLVFAHELGHNMGLRHDRYIDAGNRPFPYGHGYINQAAFAPGAPVSARWRTIMANDTQCRVQGRFECPRVPFFSNPALRLLNDPLGVPGDEQTDAVAGPADSRRALNETRVTVANFRSSDDRESCPATVTPADRFIRAPGGHFEARVTTPEDCQWTAVASDEFVLVGDAVHQGPGLVEFQVLENTGEPRSGSLEVAGQNVSVEQAGAVTLGVCDRTPPVRDILVGATGSDNCAGVSDERLARVEFMNVVVPDLATGDLAGLTGLRQLYVTVNSGPLPKDAFADLSGIEDLRVTGFFDELPEGVLAGLSGLRRLSLSAPLTQLSADTFGGLSTLEGLELTRTRLAALPAGVFEGLSGLTSLSLWGGRLAELRRGVFTGLSSLEVLTLAHNLLEEIQPEHFSPLSALHSLDLSHNELRQLPIGFFTDMSSLDSLDLSHNALRALPGGFFAGLSALESLNLSDNMLSELSDGIFADLPGLATLNLGGNRLANLRPGAFAGLVSIDRLNLDHNPLHSVPSRFLESMPRLRVLGLAASAVGHLSEDAFVGAPESLEYLNLAANLLDDVPAGVFAPLHNIRLLNLGFNGIRQLPGTLFPKEAERWKLDLGFNNLTRLPKQLFAGISLQHLFLDRNPGTPFAFRVNLRLAETDLFPSNARVIVVALERPAPFPVNVLMTASNAVLSRDRTIVSGTVATDSIRVKPGRGSLVSVSASAGVWSECGLAVLSPCYVGVRTPTGRPLRWFNAHQHIAAGGQRAIFDLADVFGATQGSLFTYMADVDDPNLVDVAVDDGVLTLESNEDHLGGTVHLTLTATDPDGVERTQRFLVIVEELGLRFMRGWRKALFAQPSREPDDGS